MALTALCLGLGIAACSSDEGRSGAGVNVARSDNPLAGQSFWIDPKSPAALQAAQWRAEGRTEEAHAMARLAARPTAHWLAEDGDVEGDVRSVTTRAAREGRSALLVAYWIPGRDCGSYSAGGAGSAAAYRDWIGRFARGLGNRRATVIVEPDAIPQTVTGCLRGGAREERLACFATRCELCRPSPGRPCTSTPATPAGCGPPPAWPAPFAGRGSPRPTASHST
jgi:endoglucanase